MSDAVASPVAEPLTATQVKLIDDHMGLAHEIGSLEVGKAADVAAFPIGARGPVQDPEDAIVFALGGQPATFVMVAGRVLREDNHPVVAEGDLCARVQRTANLLHDWLADGGELGPPPG